MRLHYTNKPLSAVLGINHCMFLELYETRKYGTIRVQTEEYCNVETGATGTQMLLQVA
jgi:hypothetical protein